MNKENEAKSAAAQSERSKLIKNALVALSNQQKIIFARVMKMATAGPNPVGYTHMAWVHCPYENGCGRSSSRFFIRYYEEYEELQRVMKDEKWICPHCDQASIELNVGYSNGETEDYETGEKFTPPRFLHLLNAAIATAKRECK